MTLLQFIASVVGSLAWPSVVLAIVLVLRKPLRDLLPLLQRLKYKDLELEFGKRIQELNAEVVAELPPSVEQQGTPPPEVSAIARLAESSPRAAVLEAWRDIEVAAVHAAQRLGLAVTADFARSFQGLRRLESSDRIDRSIVSVLRELRALRNQAAHAPEFALSTDSALEYAAAAQRVSSYLRGIASNA